MHDSKLSPSTNTGQCPSLEVLTDLVLGKLPSETIEALGCHVETCSACQAALESLDGLEDSLIADIKAQPGMVPVDLWLEQQIREAEQISQMVWKRKEQEQKQ